MRRFLTILVPGLLLASCGGAGPSQVPCKECPSVAGTYVENSARTTANCLNGDNLIWRGGTDTATLTQNGSVLTLSDSLGSVQGTLHNDFSIAFAPLQAYAYPEDGAGAPEPGELYIAGQFKITNPPSFDSTYTFVRASDSCRIAATAHWAPQQ